jgi:D-serine deaminase-like pyridoxal phosphate-dependent protein
MADSWRDLDTPVPLVDLGRLERNLREMADIAGAYGVRQRPHTKTHKTREIARRQVDLGAHGITVAKVGEAEAMVDAGFEDILIAYPVIGARKYDRMLPLLERARIRFAVDSAAGARAASDHFARYGRSVEVLIEHDGGANRSGVQNAEEAVALANLVDGLPGLTVAGIMSYANAYKTDDAAEQAEIGRAEGRAAVEVAEAVRAAGVAADTVSVGSTPTARHVVTVPGVTELRSGVYVFHDVKQVSLGVVGLDRCALTVLATVVSHPRPDRYVVDAGIKSLAGEDYGWGTHGIIVERPDLRITLATEEHGIITLPPEAEDPRWSIGDLVRIVPDHACGCANMHDALVVVDGEDVVDTWRVIGRGRVR